MVPRSGNWAGADGGEDAVCVGGYRVDGAGTFSVGYTGGGGGAYSAG